MAEYRMPGGVGESEVVEKRSRFLGQIWPVATEEEARQYIEATKKRYHDARHHCWCYRLHGGAERYSDDGEPQGTAGVPMLSLFQKAGVENLVCVVTRYFGGVLLGAGGLVRAYSQAAQEALAAAGSAVVRPWVRVEVSCPYPLLEPVKVLALQHRGELSDAVYGADVALTLLFPPDALAGFSAALSELTAGALAPRELGTVDRATPLP